MSLDLKLTAIAILTVLRVVAGCDAAAGPDGPHAEPAARQRAHRRAADTARASRSARRRRRPRSTAGIYKVVAPLDLTQNGVLPGCSARCSARSPSCTITRARRSSTSSPTPTSRRCRTPSQTADVPEAILVALLDTLITEKLLRNVPASTRSPTSSRASPSWPRTIELHDTLTVHTPAADGSAYHRPAAHRHRLHPARTPSVVAFDAREKMLAHDRDDGHGHAARQRAGRRRRPHARRRQMSCPFGELLLQAAGPLLFSQFGGATDLKGALTTWSPARRPASTSRTGSAAILSADAGGEPVRRRRSACVADQVTSRIDAIDARRRQGRRRQRRAARRLDSQAEVDYQSDRVAQGKWEWELQRRRAERRRCRRPSAATAPATPNSLGD